MASPIVSTPSCGSDSAPSPTRDANAEAGSHNQSACARCGTMPNTTGPQCSSCGAIADNFVYRSRVAAATLALFGGLFGLHRFYLKQWRALFYLAFCWTPLPWLAGIIECIVFLSSSQTAWNAKYNQGISTGRESGMVLGLFMISGLAIFAGALSLLSWLPFQAATNAFEAHQQQRAIVAATEQVATATERYIKANGRHPQNLSQLSLDKQTIDEYGQSIQLSRTELSASLPGTNGGQIIMVPVLMNGEVLWDCSGSTLVGFALPGQCR